MLSLLGSIDTLGWAFRVVVCCYQRVELIGAWGHSREEDRRKTTGEEDREEDRRKTGEQKQTRIGEWGSGKWMDTGSTGN